MTSALPTADTDPASAASPRDAKYLRTLLWLLVSVSFFEGYDGSILSLLLPDVQASFRASEALLGVVRIPIEFGLVLAFVLTNLADRIGRRRLLLWSVIGYTIFTALTALSWNIWSFAGFQFGSRIFLGAEYAVALTMIAEEYPPETRGRALGTLTTWDAFGAILVALLLGARLNESALGWRAFYLVGLGPLILLGFLRRRIRETKRFEDLSARRDAGLEPRRQSLLEVWRPGMRRDLVLIGIIHLLRSLPLYATTAWWAYFAERERGYSSLRVAITILVAYGVGCLGYYVCGRLMDTIGRRPTAIGFLLGSVAFALLEFQTTNNTIGFFALAFAVAFGLGSRPALSAWVAELFPTNVRSQAASYVRNLFEVSGLVFGPALAGILGDHMSGLIGNIGDTVSLFVLMQLPAAYLVWRHLPETKGIDLNDVDRRILVDGGDRPGRAAVTRVLVAITGVIAVVGVAVAVSSTGRERPEGVAERWLAAVSELGRPGLHDDAARRVAHLGNLDATSTLAPHPAPHDRTWFNTIEVGKAGARGVPFAVERRNANDDTETVRGFLRVSKVDGASVTDVALDAAAKVPSNGGTPAAKAPLWLWSLALSLALAMGPIISALINRMKPRPCHGNHDQWIGGRGGSGSEATA